MGRKDEARIAVIREHYLLLVGDIEQAILLDKFVYLTELQEDLESGQIWINKPISWFSDNMVIGSSPKTLSRKIEGLVEKGYLLKDSTQGKTASYQLNTQLLKKDLAKLGYTVKGYIISELLEGVEEEFAHPAKVDARKTPEEAWEDLPKDREEKKVEKKPLPKSTVNSKDDPKDWQTWVRSQKRLDQAPDYLKRVAWLVWYYTGFSPDSRTYLGDLITIYKAADGDEEVLVKGLQSGDSARQNSEKGFVFSGPRSYINYIKNERSLKDKPTTTEGKQPGKSPSMNGQEIVRVKGEEILMLGGGKRDRGRA